MESSTDEGSSAVQLIARPKSCLSLSSRLSDAEDDYWHRVMTLCSQDNPTHFGVEFPSWSFQEFLYLDSGTYSHVIRAVALDNSHETAIVFKIIKVIQRSTLTKLGALSFNGFELYADVFQEIVITKVLSNLHQVTCDSRGYEYQTHCFPRVYKSKVVHGEIPNYFIIHRYDENKAKAKPVERFDDLFGVPREHLVLVMKYCGESLWRLARDRHRVLSAKASRGIAPEQLLSVCYQVTLALAAAEGVYQFEHRDLHVCNVLVKYTKKEAVSFVIRSQSYRVKSFGVKACIIDATFSRLCLGTDVYYTDLSNRLKATASTPNPDPQEVIYQQMYQLIVDKWRDWFPTTNIFWLKYFYNEVLGSEAFKDSDSVTKQQLMDLMDTIGEFTSLIEFVQRKIRQTGDTVSNPSDSKIAPRSHRSTESLSVDEVDSPEHHSKS